MNVSTSFLSVLCILAAFSLTQPIHGSPKWVDLDREGRQAQNAGDLREAYQLHRRALQNHDAVGPRRGISYARLGQVFEKLEQPEKARAAYQRARDILFLAFGSGDTRVCRLQNRISSLPENPSDSAEQLEN